MILVVLLTALSLYSVRAEPVEARLSTDSRPSTSSGLADQEKAQTPIDAERAFAADAKTLGQWTAFRKWSTDDAVMFVPQPTNAHEFLKDRKDPPTAIDWWPTASYISCDGSLAVNTGGWKRPDGSVGYFTTVWSKRHDGAWRWLWDAGDTLKVAPRKPIKPRIVRANCRGKAIIDIGGFFGRTIYRSADQTLTASWEDTPASMFVNLWDGRHYRIPNLAGGRGQ